MHSVQMLYSFLEKRSMSVKIENEMSVPLPINGGSPQGTLLGNVIFVVATSEIDKDLSYSTDLIPNADLLQPLSQTSQELPAAETIPQAASPPRTPALATEISSPLSTPGSVRFFTRSISNVIYDSSSDSDVDSIFEHQLIRHHVIPRVWDPGEPVVVKYVDDVLGSEKLYAPAGKIHASTNKQTCTIYAKKSEELNNAITNNASVLGLKVNAKKRRWYAFLAPIPVRLPRT